MSFATWISPEFQLYIMKDYRRLKADENSRLSLNWNLNREIAKLNYLVHTDAIKDNLIPPEQISYKYANEADLLNVTLFGRTVKQWRDANLYRKGNIRDDADLNQLLLAFDKLYDTFSEVEQRDFMRAFIERIDIYPEEPENCY